MSNIEQPTKQETTLSFEYYNEQLALRDKELDSIKAQVNEMRELFKANFTRQQQPNDSTTNADKIKEIEKKIKEVFK